MSNLLSVRNLKVYYYTARGTVKAVDGVNFDVPEKGTLGLVGESGCGKTTVGLSLMRLIEPPGSIVDGKILFAGEDLLSLSDEEMRNTRGRRISMIFQDPMSCLNPVLTVGDQLTEVLTIVARMQKEEAKARAVDLLKLVGIPSPAIRMTEYPHQLSGGMRQRVVIAIALAADPRLIIADEPTTMLDATVQRQIIELLKNLIKQYMISTILVTHDLGLVAEFCDQVAVMYAGKIVEHGDALSFFDSPQHPYTQGLLSCLPKLTTSQNHLNVIDGSVPSMIDVPKGCRFHPRCFRPMKSCREIEPEMIQTEPGHYVSCFLCEKN